ncbi:MAG: hypothetical protein IJR70_08810 [Eubacterium sp.]|nr:hypothetical protein [Eubacterium sp.]
MKKIISIILAIVTLVASVSLASVAYADNSKYYIQRQQYNSHNISGGFYGKNAYFINNHTEKLYIKKSLNEKPKLVRKGICAGGTHTIYKNYVYFIGEDGVLKKCSINGKVKKSIVSGIGINNYIVTNNKIVFVAEDPFGDIGVSGLYVSDLNGKKLKRITKHLTYSLYSWGKNVYYYDFDSNCFKRYSFEKNKVYKVKFNKKIYSPEIIAMEGASIYYYKENGNLITFYKANTKTKKVTKITSKKLYGNLSFAIGNGTIYYACNDDYYTYYYKFVKSKNKFKLLKTIDAEKVCFNDMGFYRNKLITVKYRNNSPTFKYYVIDTIS